MPCRYPIVISGSLRRCINTLCLVLCGIALPLPACAFLFPSYATVYEYLNDNTGHYLLLSDPNEIRRRGCRCGWCGVRRTGYIFDTYHDHIALHGGEADVCRFSSLTRPQLPLLYGQCIGVQYFKKHQFGLGLREN